MVVWVNVFGVVFERGSKLNAKHAGPGDELAECRGFDSNAREGEGVVILTGMEAGISYRRRQGRLQKRYYLILDTSL